MDCPHIPPRNFSIYPTTITGKIGFELDCLKDKVGKAVSKVLKSPEFWVLAKGVAITAVVLTGLFFLGSNPVGWAISALAVSMLALLVISALTSAVVSDRLDSRFGVNKGVEERYHKAFTTSNMGGSINDRKGSNLRDYPGAPITFIVGAPAAVIHFVTEITRAGLAIPFWIADCLETGVRKITGHEYQKVSLINGSITTKKTDNYTKRLWIKIKEISLSSKEISYNSVNVIQGKEYRRLLYLFNTAQITPPPFQRSL